MNDDKFRLLVAEEVKKKASTEQAAWLRHPDNRERWRATLVIIHEDVDSTIHKIGDDLDHQLELWEGDSAMRDILVESAEQKRQKASRFQFFVEQRLAEIDRGDTIATADDHVAATLRDAIADHRADKGGIGDQFDDALWKVLDGEV